MSSEQSPHPGDILPKEVAAQYQAESAERAPVSGRVDVWSKILNGTDVPIRSNVVNSDADFKLVEENKE